MFSFLLAIIYIAFISLGLPDSLLGSGWPVMQAELHTPLSYAGILSMVISAGTIVSSLRSDYLTRKLGAGLVTAISVGMTAIALFGFSISNSFYILCIWAIPYGLGAGAVDSALNNYVALHYSSRHMSWLHCFWGVGVTISPYIMSFCLSRQYGWRTGYVSVSILQVILTIILFSTLFLWKGNEKQEGEEIEVRALSVRDALKIKGVPFVLAAFFGYCALETTAGMWATSYLVGYKGINPVTAAKFASLFFIGITVGRFLNGFVADRFGDRKLIRFGICIMIVGVLMIGLPIKIDVIGLAGLIVLGFGCAPVYPSIIHATPTNFGKENSQAIVGIQMACAYCGSTFMPPLFGLIAEHINMGLYPVYLMIFAVLMLVMTETLNRRVSRKITY
ncbi:MAG: MFS transporter [bacterium]|nr:MFS transporter [bacterium]